MILAGVGIPVMVQNIRKNAVANEAILKVSQLDGRRICVITGTTGDFAVRGRFKKAKILDMNYPADAALAVKTKKADAFAFDKCTLQYLVARSNGEFALLPEKLAVAEVAIPMQMNNKALHQNINAALKKLKADGTLDQMYQKWFVNVNNETPTMPRIALTGQNGTLRMGTCLLEEPFAFVFNGEKVGHDIELGYRLAQILGVKLEITDMSYDAIIAGLRSGKIDLAIANFYKFEERQKTMEFSDTYLKNGIAVLVRRDRQ